MRLVELLAEHFATRRRFVCFFVVVVVVVHFVVSKLGPIVGHGRHVCVVADLEDHHHAGLRVEIDVTVEHPVARVVGVEAKHRVAGRRIHERVFNGRIEQVALQRAVAVHLFDDVERQRVAQLLLSEDGKRVTVQVDRMALYFVFRLDLENVYYLFALMQ